MKSCALLLLAALLASCGAGDYTLTLRNRTEVDLVPYPVVTTPPPPHREADPANTLAHDSEVQIDTTGFNPLFFHEGSMKGVVIQLGLDDDPAALRVVLFQYQVPPGQEGSDPALQPQELGASVYNPTKLNLSLIHI